MGLLAAVFLVVGVGFLAFDEPAGAVVGLLALGPGPATHGLWKGHRGARMMTFVYGVGALLYVVFVDGLVWFLLATAAALLLLRSEPSRVWFGREA